MPTLSFSLNLEGGLPQFKKLLLTHICEKLNTALNRAKPAVTNRAAKVIQTAILSSPERASLSGGVLQGQLGLLNGEEAVSAIISAIQTAMEVTVEPVSSTGENISGGMTVKILRSSLSEVLSLGEGKFTSAAGYDIPWLTWLLTSGDAIVVANHWFYPGEKVGSRTGLGIMVKGRFWQVPKDFGPTHIDNNWLTRAIAVAAPEVQKSLKEEVLRGL